MNQGGPKRLVCVVEGHGEVEAVPALCAKIKDYLVAWTWIVDPQPIRQPRSSLVDEVGTSPLRLAQREGLERVLGLAAKRPADGVLVLCDADDDCAATWGPSAQAIVSSRVRGATVMVVREYEAWLLASAYGRASLGGRPIDQIRDAKKRMTTVKAGYKPTVHQLELTQTIDVAKLRELSASFDKLVRSLAKIFDAVDPRPSAAAST